jgi:hypothetical protein
MSNDDLASALSSAVESVASGWKKAKRNADKEDRVSRRDLQAMRTTRPHTWTIREAAFSVMEEAYLKASANRRYPANARQIYYAARPAILAKTGADKVDSR